LAKEGLKESRFPVLMNAAPEPGGKEGLVAVEQVRDK
jgi:hypothetical protein